MKNPIFKLLLLNGETKVAAIEDIKSKARNKIFFKTTVCKRRSGETLQKLIILYYILCLPTDKIVEIIIIIISTEYF